MQQTNAAGGIIALDEADDEDEDEDEEDDSVSGVAAPSSGMRSYSLRAAINGSGLTNPPLPFYNRHHHRQQLRRKRSFYNIFQFFQLDLWPYSISRRRKTPPRSEMQEISSF